MKKVHVVFKTHLDLGFTDLAENVIENYNSNYIPRAIELAFDLNEGQEKPKFIWTTGSYLIWQYLESQSEEKVNRLEKAIELGYINWHGLPVTFHSEAAGKFVFEQSLKITDILDERFSKKTIAAKMTDVPGHTKSIVPILKSKGISFLHIGMNGVSALPSVPENFIWKNGDSEIIVSYSTDYGTSINVEGCDDILVFAHTHDNSGPQSKERVLRELSNLEKQYPDYEVIASTLDNFAKVLLSSKIHLPVVEEEIGDSWIYGVASDPGKMRKFNRLSNLAESWIENGDIKLDDKAFKDFIFKMMLVPEHTWGMDIKRYFSDYTNYTKEDFNKARQFDKICDEALTFRYQEVVAATEPEMKYTSYEWNDRCYSTYESSWKEQRKYIEEAISCLPMNLQVIANNKLNQEHETLSGLSVQPYQEINIGEYNVKVNEHGAICMLEINGIDYASKSNLLFNLEYTVLGNDSYEKLRSQYLRDLDKHFWAIDFLKPGIELQNEIVNTHTYGAFVTEIQKHENKLIVSLQMEEEAVVKFGSPAKIKLVYTFGDKITVDLHATEKEANRYPEILSLGFNPLVNNAARYEIEKLGSLINPLDVVGNGSKLMHSLDDSIVYRASDKQFKLKAVDSRIVSIGQIDNLDYQATHVSIEKGFYFHLLNTSWGTNFTMWYEDDIKATYELEIK